MKKLLKNLSFFAISTLAVGTVHAQDPDAFLHVRFENNLEASTTESDGITFEVTDPNGEGSLIVYNSATPKEGSYAIDFSSYAYDADSGEYTDNVSIIDNSSNVQIQSTTNHSILGDDARTFAAWIRFDDISGGGGSHVILNMGDPTSSSQGRVTWTLAAAQDRIQIAVGGGNVNGNYTTGGSTDLEDGNWHHVAFTYDDGDALEDIIFYIDGNKTTNDGGSNTGNSFNTTNDLLTIGSRGNNTLKWFDGGGIDDLRVYDEALSEEEIELIYGGSLLSIEDVAFGDDELKAYPNAVVDVLNIKTTSNSVLDISVFDITGKAVIRTSGKSVDMSTLTTGLYIVKVREDNKVANLKILKK
ncbi:hypothetical protein BKP44_19575 [Formosa algae]|nr:hypothetical protein AST99_17785 [Formosa algae]PNW25546.1 hypothetical protein BKP44_19575 [Formosa algae]